MKWGICTIQFKVVWIRFGLACYLRALISSFPFISQFKEKNSNSKLFQTGCTITPEHIRRFADPNMYTVHVYVSYMYHKLLYCITYTRNNIIRCRKARSTTAGTSFCPIFAWEPGTWSLPADRRLAWCLRLWPWPSVRPPWPGWRLTVTSILYRGTTKNVCRSKFLIIFQNISKEKKPVTT